MALRQKLAKQRRLFDIKTNTNSHSPPTTPNAANSNFHLQLLSTSPDSAAKTFLRRYIHKKSAFQSAIRLPQFLSIPVGEKLRENLWPVNIPGGDRIRLDGLSPPESGGRISVDDARKILRTAQLEKIREKLRNIPVNSIAYSEFVGICSHVCSDGEHGLSCAKILDEAGNVIVLGDIVFLRTHQVTKLMENLISQFVATPNDPRKSELEQMEKQKALIDQKAESLVRAELYCGLGFMVLQTLGFMRLTFWELSWDVMEPICFFVTSIHFALAYGFFLRTSREPTFEGFFQRRLKVKQQKLMKACNFDVDKYNELCKAFYPNYVNYEKIGCFWSF